jgi:hypothetical protein
VGKSEANPETQRGGSERAALRPAGCGGDTSASGSAPRREHLSIAAYFNPQSRPGAPEAGFGDGRAEAVGTLAGTDPADAAAQLEAGPGDAGDSIYPENVDDWADRLDVTREQLRAAIRRVGSRVDDVTRYLGNPDVL